MISLYSIIVHRHEPWLMQTSTHLLYDSGFDFFSPSPFQSLQRHTVAIGLNLIYQTNLYCSIRACCLRYLSMFRTIRVSTLIWCTVFLSIFRRNGKQNIIISKYGRNERLNAVAGASERAENINCIVYFNIAFKTTKPFGAYTSSSCYYKLFSISMERRSYVALTVDAWTVNGCGSIAFWCRSKFAAPTTCHSRFGGGGGWQLWDRPKWWRHIVRQQAPAHVQCVEE